MDIKNTVLNYNKIESNNYLNDNNVLILRDFTSGNYNIPKEYNLDKYFEVLMVEDDERLDNIAHRYYSNLKYWDLIMVYNNMESPLLLPKNYNFVLDRADIRYESWYNTYGYNKPEWYLTSKKNWFVQMSMVENEKYRNIKLLKHAYLPRILKEIDEEFRVRD